MLFRKKQPRCCVYCLHSTSLSEGLVLCSKRGIRPPDSPCRGFRYDPVKRIPHRNNKLDFTKYDQEDFTL